MMANADTCSGACEKFNRRNLKSVMCFDPVRRAVPALRKSSPSIPLSLRQPPSSQNR